MRVVRASLAVAAVTICMGPVLRAGTRSVPFPFQMADGSGNQWQVYANGMLQQNGGNNPVFSQLSQMTVNGGNASMMRGGMLGKVDDKTGELTIENLTMGGVVVTRRILLIKEEGAVRCIDTFKNSGARETTINVQYNANFNFGIQAGRMVFDARKKDLNVGWAGMTNVNKAVYLTYAVGNAKVLPKITYPEGSNVLQTSFALTVPPGKEIALVHYHGTAETIDKAADVVSSIKSSKLLAGVEPELRRTIVNLASRSVAGEELEILRGDSLDVVETRGGDQLKGTLKDATYPLKTAFGRLELPADKVVAVLTMGKQRPIQLIVTSEGEVFGGEPERDFLTLLLSSGQTVKVPVSQVSRAGYRKRPGEAEEIVLSKPAVFLRSGERMAIGIPAGPIEVATRFGVIKLPVSALSSVTLRTEDSPVHQITLTDGSKFAGLLTAAKFDLTLDGAAGKVGLSLPTSAVARIRPSTLKAESDTDKAGPELKCLGEDVFVGTLDGAFLLDTAFEALQVRGDQIRKLSRPDAGGGLAGSGSPVGSEVQVTLWDQTMITGQLRDASLVVKLASGVSMPMPVDLITEYTNPNPKPSDEMTQRIKDLVAKLNDDDFKARETAQQTLVANGPSVAPLLRELREAQPPEAQQRIDQILGAIEK